MPRATRPGAQDRAEIRRQQAREERKAASQARQEKVDRDLTKRRQEQSKAQLRQSIPRTPPGNGMGVTINADSSSLTFARLQEMQRLIGGFQPALYQEEIMRGLQEAKRPRIRTILAANEPYVTDGKVAIGPLPSLKNAEGLVVEFNAQSRIYANLSLQTLAERYNQSKPSSSRILSYYPDVNALTESPWDRFDQLDREVMGRPPIDTEAENRRRLEVAEKRAQALAEQQRKAEIAAAAAERSQQQAREQDRRQQNLESFRRDSRGFDFGYDNPSPRRSSEMVWGIVDDQKYVVPSPPAAPKPKPQEPKEPALKSWESLCLINGRQARMSITNLELNIGEFIAEFFAPYDADLNWLDANMEQMVECEIDLSNQRLPVKKIRLTAMFDNYYLAGASMYSINLTTIGMPKFYLRPEAVPDGQPLVGELATTTDPEPDRKRVFWDD